MWITKLEVVDYQVICIYLIATKCPIIVPKCPIIVHKCPTIVLCKTLHFILIYFNILNNYICFFASGIAVLLPVSSGGSASR